MIQQIYLCIGWQAFPGAPAGAEAPVNCEGTGRPLRENGGNPLQTTGAGQASACLLHHSHPQ